MKKHVLLAIMLLLGCLQAQENASDSPLNTTINETINEGGPVLVNTLNQDWVSAGGTIIEQVVNGAIGKEVLLAGVGATLIGIVTLWMFRSKILAIIKWIGMFIGVAFVFGVLFLLLKAYHVV